MISENIKLNQENKIEKNSFTNLQSAGSSGCHGDVRISTVYDLTWNFAKTFQKDILEPKGQLNVFLSIVGLTVDFKTFID